MIDPISALKQLTPNGPNRDELLLAVGRQSVRPNRYWKLATLVLAVSQVVTLILLLWPARQLPPLDLPPTPVRPNQPEPVEPEEPERFPLTPDPNSYLALSLNDAAVTPPKVVAPLPARMQSTLRAGTRQYD